MRTRPVLVVAAATLLTLVPSAALAHHPEIEASQDCAGLVAFTAQAWSDEGATPERRTNNHVVVKLLEADGGGPIAEYRGSFTAANGYSFSGEHRLDEPGELVVKVIAKARWGPDENFADAGESRRTRVEPPDENCDAAGVPTSTVGQEVVDAGQGPPGGTSAPAGEAGGPLPFTGPSTTIPLLIGGLTLIAGGMLALRSGRSWRSGPRGRASRRATGGR